MELWLISFSVILLQNGYSMAISPDVFRSSTSTEDFLSKFVRMPDGSKMSVSNIHNHSANTDAMHISGVGSATLASYDRCEPRYVTVMLDKDPNPNVLLWPPCTRVERCSGCCPSDVLICEPIQTEMITLKVIKNIMPYEGSPEFQFAGMQDVTVERHLKCDQRCRVKARDCNPNIHDYLERDCRCRCRQRQTCASSDHIWREENCRCECVQRKECNGFARFDESTCDCDLRQLVSSGMTDEERAELTEILLADQAAQRRPVVPTTTTTTTPAPVGCPPMRCMPGWAPQRLRTGTCHCMPGGFSLPGRRRRRRWAH